MPDLPLPDDVSAWPHDPFALLGVPHSADAADLRRAYNRLVRVYRPDDRPSEFQKVREAYERAQRQLQWRQFEESDAESELATPETRERPAASHPPGNEPSAAASIDFDSAPHASGSPPQPQRTWAPRPAAAFPEPFADRLDAAWKLGRDGDVEGCRKRLLQLREEAPHDAEPYLRLYWLHRLLPELAAATPPVTWLDAGLRATRLSPRLLPAYAEELETSALILLEPASAELLKIDAPDERRVELAAMRIAGAARMQEWSLIDTDLDLLRPRLTIDAPDDWIRLLFLVMDHAVWTELWSGRLLVERCEREFRAIRDRELALREEYERLAFLKELAADPYLLPGGAAPESLSRLIRKSWTASRLELRYEFLDLVGGWLQAPLAALGAVTNLAIHSPVGFHQLWTTVRRFEIAESMWPNPQRRAKLGQRIEFFTAQVRGTSYTEWRDDLLEFCLNELIWPEEIPVPNNPGALLRTADQEIEASIREDLPLACLFHACMAFLSEAG